MNKKIFLFLGVASFSLFDKIKSEIKFKLEEKSKFQSIKTYENGEMIEKKIIPGTYEIIIYDIKYPNDIFLKNKFYKDLKSFIDLNYKDGKKISSKKYSIIIDSNFYKDIDKIENEELFQEEEFLGVEASSLTFDQKSILSNLTNKLNLKEYIGTDQEYLNRQIYVIYELLGKKDYNVHNVYSELDKEFLLTQLKDERKKTTANFKNLEIESFIARDFSETKFNKYEDDVLYKFDKDIVLSTEISESAIFPDVQSNIYIRNFNDKLLTTILNNKIKLKRQLLLIENKNYVGYTYNEENEYIFIGGDKGIYYYPEYKINILKKEIDISKLSNVDSNYYVSDFFSNVKK